ncbi:MAG TPA: diguanylate cyclase [Acidimicrobiia bacterium]|nr:diguanylate cyclase [Acidimicrobiia bacterium]
MSEDPVDLDRAFRALVEHSSDIVTILEPDGRWRWASTAARRVLGYTDPADVGADDVFGIVHPDDVDTARAAFAAIRKGTRGPEQPVTLRVRDRAGLWHYLEMRGQNLTAEPALRAIVVTARDVTHRREEERRVARLIEVLEGSAEIVVLTDAQARPIYANRKARNLFDLEMGEAVDDLSTRVDAESLHRVESEVLPRLRESGAWTGELTLVTHAGDELPVAITIQMHASALGAGPAFVSAIAHDIKELQRAQAQLAHQATHDSLTGLPNRSLFQELGEQALARAQREGTTVAVLFLDLDHFKPVNDTMGHATGDALLVRLSTRLRKTVRAGDLVARFGGDEFVVLCEHPAGAREMLELAERLIETLSLPVEIDGRAAQVGASVGIAIGAGGRVTIDSLLRDADAALYRAKETGRGRAMLFGPGRELPA